MGEDSVGQSWRLEKMYVSIIDVESTSTNIEKGLILAENCSKKHREVVGKLVGNFPIRFPICACAVCTYPKTGIAHAVFDAVFFNQSQ